MSSHFPLNKLRYLGRRPGDKADTEKKRKKHPLAPRHPMSAYLHFLKENRPKLNVQFPNKSFAEIAQLCGERWRELPVEERRPYEVMSAADKRRYEEEKSKWIPPPGKRTQPLPLDVLSCLGGSSLM